MSITPTEHNRSGCFFFGVGFGTILIGLGFLFGGYFLYRDQLNGPSNGKEAPFRIESAIHQLKDALVGGEYPIPYVFINDTDHPVRIVGLAPT